LQVQGRIAEIEKGIQDADQALAEDTKSSAGDKYETSREMLQQDLNRYQQQLVIAQQDRGILEKIDADKLLSAAGVGALIQTETATYFIAISIGMVRLGQETIYVISPQSPIGKALLTKKVGEGFSFNGKHSVITAIA